MAAHDFAQIEVAQEEVEKPLTRTKTMLLTVLSVLLVLGTFIGGFWLGQKQGIETAAGEDKARLEKLLKEQRDEMKVLRQEAAKQKKVKPDVSTTQVGDLTFYNELPHQSVKPSPLHAENTPAKNMQRQAVPDSHEPSASTADMRKMIKQEMRQSPQKDVTLVAPKLAPKVIHAHASKSTQGFILQVGSFQQRADADALLPKLMKRGFSPSVRRVELPSLGVWYRVYITGYDSKEAANKAKITVKKSLNITALILKAS